MNFQHNKLKITKESYTYVFEYKQQLLYSITKLLNDLGIKFVISHGNLIEFTRNKPIYHDDDLDIRFNKNDFYKWENFCNNNNKILPKYNLKFDHRFKDFHKQIYNGIQCRLIKFYNKNNINEYEMNLHCDLVANIVGNKFWPDYNINYNSLRKIKYLSVETFAPSIKDTHKVLSKQYGNYLIPDK